MLRIHCLISFDILLEWREHFKLGHPISNVIMAKLTFLNQKLEELVKNWLLQTN